MKTLRHLGITLGALLLVTSLLGANTQVNAAGKLSPAGVTATARFTDATAITGGYGFTPVADPADTTVPPFTQLLGINEKGDIVGYYGDGGTDVQHPNKGFVTNVSLLHTFLPWNYPGSVQTQAIGVNANDQTVGFYVDSAGVTHGFMTTHQTFTTVDLPGTTSNTLNGLNDADTTVGFYQYGANGVAQPYTRQVDGTFVLPPIANAQETGINNSGVISGFSTDSAGNAHGFLLQNGVEKVLNYPGAVSTQALGLNNTGQVVGTYTDTAGNMSGFIYNQTNGNWQTIQVPNSNMTTISGINDLGWIVGFYQTAAGATVGFVGRLASTTSLTASANPALAGRAVTLTVHVSPSAATGTVTLSDGTTTLTTGQLSGGSFQYTTSSLPAGVHQLMAVYGGGAYSGSTGTLTESIASAVATLSPQNGSTASGIAYLTPASHAGQVDVYEQVSGLAPNSLHPTHIHAGTYCDANGPILFVFPNLQANAQGVASIAYTFNASSIPVTGWYINVHTGPTLAGNGATPISCGVVHPAGATATTTTLLVNNQPSPQTLVPGSPLTFAVNVSPSTATGTVELIDTYTDTSGNTAAPRTLTTGQLSGGSFSYVVPASGTSGLAQGHHSIIAVYDGDGTHVGSTTAPYMLALQLQPSSITLTANVPHTVTVGSAVTLSGAVAPSDAFGQVMITDSYTDTTGVKGTRTIAEVHTLTRGQYTYMIPSFSANGLSLGTNVLTAEYLGNATFSTSYSAPYTQIVVAGHS